MAKAKPQPKGPNWTEIQGAYVAGQDSLRTIADRNGITEGTIRARAKKFGWVRNAPETKRKLVAARMAGVTQDVAQNVMRNVEAEVDQDVLDLQRGLRIHRFCLMALEQSAETAKEPREVKVIVEAAGAAIDSIRRIRGLDEPGNKPPGSEEDDARAEAITSRLAAKLAPTTA